MAPVLAITGLVARTLMYRSFDPVGEIPKPFVTGPNRVSIFPPRRAEMTIDKKLWRNRKERKELARRLRSEDPGLEVVHPCARGVATCIQRMQKALTQMNIQLANVISDLSGMTGMRIVRAILAGERDPHALAALSHPGIHASRATIAKSLEGTWQPELVFVLHQEVTMYDAYEQRIAECDHALQDQLKGFIPKLGDT